MPTTKSFVSARKMCLNQLFHHLNAREQNNTWIRIDSPQIDIKRLGKPRASGKILFIHKEHGNTTKTSEA